MKSGQKKSGKRALLARTLNSVAGKFTVGLAVWFAVTVTLGVGSLLYLTKFQQSLSTLTDKSLPSADSSAKLAVATTSLTGSVRRFALVETQVQRRLAIKEIETDLSAIDALTPQLERSRDFATFINVLTTIKQSIARLDTQIDQRIAVNERRQASTSTLSNLLSNGYFTLEGASDRDQTAILTWQNNMVALLIKVIESANIDKVRDTRLLRQQLARDLAANRLISDAFPDDLKNQAQVREARLAGILFDEGGYLESLLDGLKLTGRVRGIESQVLTLNDEITKLSAGIFEQAADATAQDARTVDASVNAQIIYTIIAGILMIAATIVVAVYLRRAIVLRLNRLSIEVQNYSRGEGQDITVSGKDEISDISMSIKNFIREIEDQQAALIEAKSRAEDATRSKSEFLATMSHEIRTPMNGVVSMTEMLAKTKLDIKQRELITIVQQSASSLLTIINDILDFSRIEAGKLDIEETPFNLQELVTGVAALCGADAYDKGLEFYYRIEPDVQNMVIGDPTRIRQILLNLVSNAVKFTETGHVIVTVTQENRPSGKMLKFEVCDTGIGISHEAVGRLFKAFEQADGSTVRRFGGSGLGLSICKRLVELMGGEIGVDTTQGVGSEFYFTAPVQVADGQDAVHHKDQPGFDQVFILTRQDLTATLIKENLGDRVGMITELDPELPETWSTTLDKLKASISDIVVIDSALFREAGLSGYARDAFAARSMPVIILAPRTEFAGYDTPDWSWIAGLIAKPISQYAFFDNIHRLLSESEGADATHEAVEIKTDRNAAEARKEVVLIAEDNIINQKVIARLFEAMGFQYDIVNDGKEAMAAVERGYYGAILTDFHMPNMDGVMLSKELRAHPDKAISSLPIIMLTADAQSEAEEIGLDAGIQGFLSKPIILEELHSELTKWLPNTSAAA